MRRENCVKNVQQPIKSIWLIELRKGTKTSTKNRQLKRDHGGKKVLGSAEAENNGRKSLPYLCQAQLSHQNRQFFLQFAWDQ
jgi:hypothetical protein